VPTLAEHACLALVDQGVDHGWAIGSLLAPDGELGRVWSLSRPLTYRAIDVLVDEDLLRRGPPKPGRGRARSPLRLTSSGRAELAAWIDAPVDHIRDVRTELLLKLLLRERAGLDARALAIAQRDHLSATFAVNAAAGDDGDIVSLWRRENTAGVWRFLDAMTGRSVRR